MADKVSAPRIAALSRLCGMAQEYRDNFGARRRTSRATNQAFLTAVGVPWETPERLDREMAKRRRGAANRLLEPVQVILPEEEPLKVALHPWGGPGADFRMGCELADESGEKRAWEVLGRLSPSDPAGSPGRLQLSLPAGLKFGYYDLRLTFSADGREEEIVSRLILAPSRVYEPEPLAAGARVWGLNVPLYALRSGRNWGMGDFSDLARVIDWAGSLGAAFVGVNPLHAPAPEAEASPSPYFPTSRRFLNFLYLDLEAVPELAQCDEARSWLAGPEIQAALGRLRARDFISYPEVWGLKLKGLELFYRRFRQDHGSPESPRTARGREFSRFIAGAGPELEQFGRFSALAGFLGASDWPRWPRRYQDPQSPAVESFAREHRDRVNFHLYVQWLAEGQLEAARGRAGQAGLAFTLYQDLALGAASGGFDTWAHQDQFAPDMEIGAPPDPFNHKGQKWGLPPLIPEKMRASGHRLFLESLRANCPPWGLLRLDHVMGLFRLFWIPRGRDPREGAYVHYPARELLAILALESRRHKTLIIGEDLGTVSPAIRRALNRWQLYSYRVFYFEKNFAGGFKTPEEYPRRAVATVTTHDLPTLAGFWEERDLALRRQLRLYPKAEAADQEAAARDRDRELLLQALDRQGLLEACDPSIPKSRACGPEVSRGVLEYLARSPAALLEVRLEEVFRFKEQQNLPGTTHEHPNWQRKLPLTLEEMAASPEGEEVALRLRGRARDW